MKHVIVLSCLLFTVRVLAGNTYYRTDFFEGNVTIKAGGEEYRAQAQYVIRDELYELTIVPDDESKDPIVISALRGKIENNDFFGIYSADGKHRIGRGALAVEKDDPAVWEFALLDKGTKVADVRIEIGYYIREIPTLHVNFKLSGTIDLSFEGDLPY